MQYLSIGTKNLRTVHNDLKFFLYKLYDKRMLDTYCNNIDGSLSEALESFVLWSLFIATRFIGSI